MKASREAARDGGAGGGAAAAAVLRSRFPIRWRARLQQRPTSSRPPSRTWMPQASFWPLQRAEQPARRERPEKAEPSFVLPGESLSKYGGQPAASAAKPSAPARPTTTFKPSSLIETPLAWDGSGLLPGESFARHRGRQEPAEATQAELDAEPQGVFSDAPGGLARA